MQNRRVDVFSGDGVTPLGKGTYVDDVAVYFLEMADGSLRSATNAEEAPALELIPEGAKLHKTAKNPKILLDSGKTVYGCQVYWKDVYENS